MRQEKRQRRRARPAVVVALCAGGLLLGAGSLASSAADGSPGSVVATGASGAASTSTRGAQAPPGRAGGDPPVLRDRGGPPDGTGDDADGTAPTVANLDPALRSALRRAAADAGGEGVAMHVNSGWRSAEEQERLLRDAISTYGSAAEAARWVARPETSAHVSGDAVDVGPPEAAAWLATHGPAYGLCRVYDNEPWHYELRPDAAAEGCPARYADPTADPRMQR